MNHSIKFIAAAIGIIATLTLSAMSQPATPPITITTTSELPVLQLAPQRCGEIHLIGKHNKCYL